MLGQLTSLNQSILCKPAYFRCFDSRSAINSFSWPHKNFSYLLICSHSRRGPRCLSFSQGNFHQDERHFLAVASLPFCCFSVGVLALGDQTASLLSFYLSLVFLPLGFAFVSFRQSLFTVIHGTASGATGFFYWRSSMEPSIRSLMGSPTRPSTGSSMHQNVCLLQMGCRFPMFHS